MFIEILVEIECTIACQSFSLNDSSLVGEEYFTWCLSDHASSVLMNEWREMAGAEKFESELRNY